MLASRPEQPMSDRVPVVRALSFAGCLLSRGRGPHGSTACPGLSWNVCRHRLSAEICNNPPDCVGGQDAAVCRHSPRAAIEDRVKNLAIRAPIPPSSVHQARTHPSEPAGAVTPVAVHRTEKLFAILDLLRIASKWIDRFPGRRIGPARPNMRLIHD